MAQHFDADLVNQINDIEEVDIETQGDTAGTTHRTTIWVVIDGSDVYIRSYRGPAGRWYREITGRPSAVLHVGTQRIPVRAVPATDEHTIAQVSNEYLRKYAERYPVEARAMLGEETLPMTLRLEPA